ncbi:Crp/Fnr family transcriptional regulator [Ravibacter arvi]|uniref:Crp/Fnr family transcriptional regulator n=1 Tax=Ravibacter arvi TaxID=2051041 RepID=A0ABP8LY67_9BACT
MADQFKKYLADKAMLSEDEFRELEPFLTRKHFRPGEFVLLEGDVCKSHIFVESGLLRSYSVDEAGKEHILQFAPENWFIGDRGSYYFGEPSQMNIQAIEPTDVVMFDQLFIEKAMCSNPSYGVFNERLLQNHIRQLQGRINLLLSATAEQRYLHFIETYFDLTFRIPQWMIASYLGITPESLSRVRKDLARKNQKV